MAGTLAGRLEIDSSWKSTKILYQILHINVWELDTPSVLRGSMVIHCGRNMERHIMYSENYIEEPKFGLNSFQPSSYVFYSHHLPQV